MKAVSIHQPWADLTIDNRRSLEIRNWAPSYRGPLLIHTGLTVEKEECARLEVTPSAVGAIIGLVELVSAEELSKQKWAALRHLHLMEGSRPYGNDTLGWSLKSGARLRIPIPFRGMLGIFNVPNDILPKYNIIKKGKIIESIIPGRYAGWRRGKIFGRLDCESGMRKIKKENRVFFLTWEDAIAAGYRPCKICRPAPDDNYK